MELDSRARFFLEELRDKLPSANGASPSSSSESELLDGRVVGGFTLGKLIGVGSKGLVFEAHSPEQPQGAVKVLPAVNGDKLDRSLFNREVEIGQRLNHCCIPKVWSSLELYNARFVFMERAQGVTLREFMNSPLSVSHFLKIFRPIADALQAAHLEGVVHRDIKPENIMVSDSGEVKVLDFGMARLTQAEGVTMTGQIKGTIAYMAPEQANDSSRVSYNCDQFAFGLMAFEALTGKFAYEMTSNNPMMNLMSRLEGEARPLREIDDSFSLQTEACLAKMLKREAGSRYASIELAFSTLAQTLR